MNDKLTKKEIQQAYKERKVIGCVYAIKNNVNGKMLVQSAADIKGIMNRFEFSRTMNSCVHPKLQNDWNEIGGKGFSFEVLEELEKKEEQTDKEFREDLKVLAELWLGKLDRVKLY